MHSHNHVFGRLLAVAVMFTLMAWSDIALSQSKNRQIGKKYTGTADPLVARPNSQPCVVRLFTNFQFAFFSDTDQNFTATPPAGCSGPWQRVVLDIDFSENAGRQFDRTASLYVG